VPDRVPQNYRHHRRQLGDADGRSAKASGAEDRGEGFLHLAVQRKTPLLGFRENQLAIDDNVELAALAGANSDISAV